MTKNQKKRISFFWMLDQQKFETNLMLALNKALLKVKKETQFCKIRYLLLRAVSIFFIKKANAKSIVFLLLNILI